MDKLSKPIPEARSLKATVLVLFKLSWYCLRFSQLQFFEGHTLIQGLVLCVLNNQNKSGMCVSAIFCWADKLVYFRIYVCVGKRGRVSD
jgi:hypothetical protein